MEIFKEAFVLAPWLAPFYLAALIAYFVAPLLLTIVLATILKFVVSKDYVLGRSAFFIGAVSINFPVTGHLGREEILGSFASVYFIADKATIEVADGSIAWLIFLVIASLFVALKLFPRAKDSLYSGEKVVQNLPLTVAGLGLIAYSIFYINRLVPFTLGKIHIQIRWLRDYEIVNYLVVPITIGTSMFIVGLLLSRAQSSFQSRSFLYTTYILIGIGVYMYFWRIAGVVVVCGACVGLMLDYALRQRAESASIKRRKWL